MNTKCICDGKEELEIKDYIRTINGKVYTIKNVPHYICTRCDGVSFDINDKIASTLKFAVDNNLEIVDLMPDVK